MQSHQAQIWSYWWLKAPRQVLGSLEMAGKSQYEKIIEANGFPNVFQQAMSDYYWLLENDYIIIKLLIVPDYSDCRRAIWSTLNHQTSPPWGRVFVADFPGAQWQPFRASAFFSRAMQRHGGQVYRLDIWERRLVSWSPFRNLKVKACGYILLEHLRINSKKIPQKKNSTLAAEGKSPA